MDMTDTVDESKVTISGEVYNVREIMKDAGLEGWENIDANWYEYEVFKIDDKGSIVDSWDSRVETYNGVQKLTEERATEALAYAIEQGGMF
jgi:hypothetical protein